MSVADAVLEHALLPVRAGDAAAFEAAMGEAVTYLARQPGYGGHSVTRQLEDAGVYLLLVTWQSLAAHEAFRASADYRQWRTLLHHFYDPFPTVTHFRTTPVSGSLPVL